MQPLDDQSLSEESQLISLLKTARDGSVENQNRLLKHLRSYFHLMAQNELGAQLQRKVGNSDVVQQSCIKVIEGIDRFQGTTEGQLRGWLRTILTNEVNQVGRQLKSQKRDVAREVFVDRDDSYQSPTAQLLDINLTPQSQALSNERADFVRTALSRLPKDYQQVIKLRSWEHLTFPQIAEQIGKSVNATEKIWYRAIKCLRKELNELNDRSQ